MDTVIISKMSLTEAQQCATDIKIGINNVGEKLLQLYEGSGWEVLGYSSWRECAQIEFGFKQSRVYQLLGYAEVKRNLDVVITPTDDSNSVSTIVERTNNLKITESQARPLTKLKPEDQRAAWAEAVESAPSGKVTAKHVSQVVDRRQAVASAGKKSYSFETPTPNYDNLKKEISQPHVTKNSGNDEWYTPKRFIESARKVMGSIDLDPASCKMANDVVGATTYYSKEDNGLSFEWAGNLWMNPPYTRGVIDEFCSKLAESEDVKQACVLVNNATDTGWFADLFSIATTICFVDKRIKFIDTNGREANKPLQGQAVIYIGDNIDDFYHEFSKHGHIVYVCAE